MFRKLTIVIIVIGLAWNLFVYAPKTKAAAVVHDPLNAIINGVTAGSSTSLAVKEYVLDTIARAIARSLLNVAVSGIINKIQTGGRDGGPAFVQNWRNFQTDAQYRGENVFRSILASTTLCNYTSVGIKSLFGANQRVSSTGQNLRVNNFDPFSLRAACTMPSNFNLTNYQNDFAGNGGWNAWSRMLEPQNNYYGLLFGSLDEAARQRALEESGDMNEALAGSGYTSIRDKNCTGTGAGAKCVFMGKIFTPGDLLGKSAASTIDSDLGWLVSSDELSEVIIALGSAITNRIINLATSNSSNDYRNAPRADTSSSDGYLACINACPAANDLTCQTNCASAWGYNTPQASSTPPNEPPPPEEEPDSLLSDIQAERGTYGTPMSPVQLSALLNAVAWRNQAVGWGLLSKPSGNNCPSASGPISCDILFHRPSGLHYDVLSDSENTAAPTWNLVGPMDISRWIAPIQP